MKLQFPSLEFFKALQQRTKDEAAAFEKLGYCDKGTSPPPPSHSSTGA
jgi:hypothetical protein